MIVQTVVGTPSSVSGVVKHLTYRNPLSHESVKWGGDLIKIAKSLTHSESQTKHAAQTAS